MNCQQFIIFIADIKLVANQKQELNNGASKNTK